MTNWKTETTKTYDESAEALAEYFKGIGPRVLYIDLAFKLIGYKEHAKVVEIGCGDARDASEIIKRTDNYIGFDPSHGMIKLAKKRLPQATFVVSDALSFEYPPGVDIVFAFSSLLHINRVELAQVIKRLAGSMKSGSLLYMSLKESDHYEEKVKQDQFGERMFYYYSVQDILTMSKDLFEPVIEIHEVIGHTKWFELGLKRK